MRPATAAEWAALVGTPALERVAPRTGLPQGSRQGFPRGQETHSCPTWRRGCGDIPALQMAGASPCPTMATGDDDSERV